MCSRPSLKWIALALAAAFLALACATSEESAPSPTPGETKQQDCRPTVEHVPFEVPLPTYLPYGMSLRNVCLSPPPPVGEFRPADFVFANSERTAGFMITAALVDIGIGGGTPIALGGGTAELQAAPREGGGENLSLRLRRGGLTYILITTIGLRDNKLTQQDMLRIAESIP